MVSLVRYTQPVGEVFKKHRRSGVKNTAKLRRAVGKNRLVKTQVLWYFLKTCVSCQCSAWVWFGNIPHQNWKCLANFFFGLNYVKCMHLLKEFVPCQHLQTVRDIFASHLQMPPLWENVDTVSLLPELNFENLNSIFTNWSGLLFQT